MNKPTDTQREKEASWVDINDRWWDVETGKAIGCTQEQADEVKRAVEAARELDFTLFNELYRQQDEHHGRPTRNNNSADLCYD